jgi:hypothetical protein
MNDRLPQTIETATYLAEDYHQKYYLRQEAELMKEFDRMCDRTQFINSTIAAKEKNFARYKVSIMGFPELFPL